MALVTRSYLHKHDRNTNRNALFSDDGHKQPHSKPKTSSGAWKRLFVTNLYKSQQRWIPTLSGIIEAGDEGLYSSTLFTNQREHHGPISYKDLLEAFSDKLKDCSLTDRSIYSREICKFLSTARSGGDGRGMVRSWTHKDTIGARTEVTSKTRRKSMGSPIVDKGMTKRLLIERPALVLIPMDTGLIKTDKLSAMSGSWMQDGIFVETHDGTTGIKVTPAELTALSLVLGSPLNIANSKTEAMPAQQGALGISISSGMTECEEYQIVLNAHKRGIAQVPADGSGFSPLFAKHLAFGSLPFSQNATTVLSILITNETVDVIRSGGPFSLQRSSTRTPQWKYLASLPNSREPIPYMVSSSCTTEASTIPIDAMANLPFTGGLTPLASSPLVAAVRFVASGGLAPGRLLQRLQVLVDKVHDHSPHLNIFGSLYEPHNAGLLFRERERLGWLAMGIVSSDMLADRVARMHRYTTLLERLMALVPNPNLEDVLAAVQKVSKKEIHRAYVDAVAFHAATTPGSSVSIDSQRPVNTSREHDSSASRQSPASSRTESIVSVHGGSGAFPGQDLGREMEQILEIELPLSVEAIAIVARMVLVAWTLSVETVAWNEGEEGFRLPTLGSLPDKMVLL